MANIKITRARLVKGITVPAGQPNVITLLPNGASLVRLLGMFFDLNKCFLLPSVMGGIREIKNQYDLHPSSNVLVVGHTDTSGNDDPNLTLSLERADSVAAFMRDDVAAWEKFFLNGVSAEKRWGIREIQFMLSVLPEGRTPFYEEEPTGVLDDPTDEAIREFQTFKSLKVDGIAGEKTRKALITEYMGLDGTSLPSGINLTAHGCGENFPHTLSDAALADPSLRAAEIQNGVRDDKDRRVEVYYFDGPIVPAPSPTRKSGKTATDYPIWRSEVVETLDISLLDSVVRNTPLPTVKARVPLVFRRHKSFPGPSALPMLQAIAQAMGADPTLVAVVVGHTDTFGDSNANESLSDSRAKAVVAVLAQDVPFLQSQFDLSDENAQWDLMESVEMAQTILAPRGFPPILQPGQDDVTEFQTAKGLPRTGLLDAPTRSALIQGYLSAANLSAIPAAGFRTFGGAATMAVFPMAGNDPANEDPVSDSFVDRRRVDIFLFAAKDVAAVDQALSDRATFPSVYKTWCKSPVVPLLTPTGALQVRFDDGQGNALANTVLNLHAGDDVLAEQPPLTSATTDGSGIATFGVAPGAFTIAVGSGANAQRGGLRSRAGFPNRFGFTLFTPPGG